MRTMLRSGMLVMGLGLLACADPTVRSAPGAMADPSRIFSRLELSYHAITLRVESGFDTMTLQAIPRTPTGAVLTTAEAADAPVTYRVANNHPSLIVSTLGQLQAKAPVSRVLVIASQTIGVVTFVDTAVVSIVSAATPRPAIASLSLQPLPGDSAKVDCSGQYTDTLVVRPLDATGAPVPGTFLASYRSSDPLTATISGTGVIEGVRPGVVTLVTDAFIAGQGFRDSVQYTISEPLLQAVWIVLRTGPNGTPPSRMASPGEVIIATGGSVYWMNASPQPVDILFDAPEAALPSVSSSGTIFAASGKRYVNNTDGCPMAGGGNLPMLQIPVPLYIGENLYLTQVPCASVGARKFVVPGTYTYRSTDASIVGRVIVQ